MPPARCACFSRFISRRSSRVSIAALSDAPPARRGAILQALARLHYREGVWRGTLPEWWGTRPDTTGPYYDPVAWEESARIRACCSMRCSSQRPARDRAGVHATVSDLQRNRVLPPGGEGCWPRSATDRHALSATWPRAGGQVRLDVDAPRASPRPHRTRADQYRAAVVKMVVAAGPPTPPPPLYCGSRGRHDAGRRRACDRVYRAGVGHRSGGAPPPVDAFAGSVPAAGLDEPLETVAPVHCSPAHATNVAALAHSPRRRRSGAPGAPHRAPSAGRRSPRAGGAGGRARWRRCGRRRWPWPWWRQSAAIEAPAPKHGRQSKRVGGSAPDNLVRAVGRGVALRYRDRIES